MTLFSFGFSLILLFCVWEFMWKKTIQDRTRDKLFDLRDAALDKFQELGLPLDSGAHLHLRDMLNRHIALAPDITLTRYFAVIATLSKDKDLEKEFQDQEKDYATGNWELDRFIQKTRVEAAQVMLGHMFMRSLVSALFLWTLCVITLAVFGLRFVYTRLTQGAAFCERWVAGMALSLLPERAGLTPAMAEQYSKHARVRYPRRNTEYVDSY